MSGKIRKAQDSLHYLLSKFPCVAVIGARQVGKTTLLKQLLPQAAFFDLEKQKDLERIRQDPEFFLSEQPKPIVIDEAQLYPELFSALRVCIDEHRNIPGQFIISGSSSPELLNNISESLAGRIAIFELGTLQFAEIFDSQISPFYTLLKEKKYRDILDIPSIKSDQSIYAPLISSAYPEPFLQKQDPQFVSIWMLNYFNTYINRDIRRLFPRLQIETYQRFIKMMAYASGQIINYSNFARSLDVSQPTIKSYFHIAEGTFLWRSIPFFNQNSTKRIVKMPKGYLRDPGLISHLLNIRTIEDLKCHPQFGFIWESYIIEQLLKAFSTQLFKIDYSFYRTHHNAEIDLIIEFGAGPIPIEIKSGSLIKASQLITLKSFMETYKSPIGFVINQGETPCFLTSSIIQLPALYL